MHTITLHVTRTESKLLRLALCNMSTASSNFVKADRLQRKIGQAVELHGLTQKNVKRTKRA